MPRLGLFQSQADWLAEADRLRTAVLEKVVYRGQAVQVARRPNQGRVARHDPWRARLSHQEAPLRGSPRNVDPRAALASRRNWPARCPPSWTSTVTPARSARPRRPNNSCASTRRNAGMLALNVRVDRDGTTRHDRLRPHVHEPVWTLCGSSGLAPFYLSMRRGLDLLLSLEHADPRRVAVTGLSSGGWQTIVISSLDPRVKLSTPVAGYSSFPHPRHASERPRRPRADAQRPRHAGRLHASDGHVGAAGGAVDLQLEGQLLLRIHVRLAAALGRRAAHLPPVCQRELPALARQRRPRHAHLRRGQPPGLLPRAGRFFLPGRQDFRRQGNPLPGRGQDPGTTASRPAGQERDLQ